MTTTLVSVVLHWKRLRVWAPLPAFTTRWCCWTVPHPPSPTPSAHPPPPHAPVPHAHLVTFFLNCLPSVTLSVTSPVILPCTCKLWLFCAEMRQTGGSLLPRSPSLKTTTEKEKKSKHIVVESHFVSGASWLTPPRPLPPDELHPFVHPSVWHPSVRRPQRRFGPESSNLAYLKKRWF